jgi:hypothetical protein
VFIYKIQQSNNIISAFSQGIYLIMKDKIVTIILFLYTIMLFGQDKETYLLRNKNILDSNYTFPESDAKVIGFGAYHGSSKTEDAELFLLQSLINQNGVDYYFAETDISIAYYFNEYLKNGDEILLKDIIEHYGTRIPQERTVNVLEKWKRLKLINDKLPKNKKITVLGADIIATYKYTYRHLLSTIKNSSEWPLASELMTTVAKDTTDFSPYYDSYTKNQLKQFVSDYENTPVKYDKLIRDRAMFLHIINGIKTSFMAKYSREKQMYANYIRLSDIYNLKNKKQFFRLGCSHLLKHKEADGASFFSMLIDNRIYSKNKVKSVLGYLATSEVFWKDVYKNGEYSTSVNKGGEVTGDGPTAYYRGIEHLKKQSTSDLSIFKLNNLKSPYRAPGCIDLIELVTSDTKQINYGNTATTDYLDYAVLISNSPASTSIYTICKP